MKLSIPLKLSLASTLLVLISSGVISGLNYYKTTELLVDRALKNISNEVYDSGQLLQNIINTQKDDVLFLSNTPPVQGILRTRFGGNYDKSTNSSYKQWVDRLENIFAAQLKRKKTYLSIRFINKNGQEIIHSTRRQINITHLKGNQLQNKSSRKYVSKTIALSANAVYISEINLNREFGKVTIPHQEVLRTATPIYDEITGNLSGVLAITAEIGTKLRQIQKRIQNKGNNNIYITNDSGGYLLNPDPTKSYGFDLGKRYRIQEDFPHLAKMLTPDNNDTHLTLLPHQTNNKLVVDFTKIPIDSSHDNHFITVTMTQNYKDIVAIESKVLNNTMLLALLLAIVAMIIGVLFSIQLTRPLKQMAFIADNFSKKGKSNITLPVGRSDEVGQLARSFNSMINQVTESQNNLNDINNNLEKLISERTQSLEHSEAHQRLILETIADAIITIDEKGEIKTFNHAAMNIFGYSADEIIGENVSILLPKDKRLQHHEYTDEISLNAPRVINVTQDLIAQRKDGSHFPIELNLSPIESEVEKGIVSVIRDITERKRIEKMKNEFISTVSHELRTPLTSIKGSLSLITNGAFGELPKEVNNMLDIASNNSERLLLLINDILDIQKIESGQMDFNYEVFSLTELAELAVRDNQSYADQYDVTYTISNTLTEAYINADKNRLMQVMSNLLSNAAKFSNKDTQVEISSSIMNKNRVRISVTDYGAGIPDKFLPKLWDKFTQSDSSDTRQIGGTGLGLNVSKTIVEQMNGNIGVESTEGEGSTFWFEFSLSKKK